MPPLRNTAAVQAEEPAPSSDTEAAYEARELSQREQAAQSFRSGQYPRPSMSHSPNIFEEGSSAGGGGVAGRGEMGGGGRQHPMAMAGMGRGFDPAEAGRSSEHPDYSHPQYPTPLRSSYTRTQPPPPQGPFYNTPPPASGSFYQESTFTYPPPPPPGHREQQQQQQQASLPPAWHAVREPEAGPSFQHIDFESYIDSRGRQDWRPVPSPDTRASQASSSYDPRNRYPPPHEVPYGTAYWQQQYETAYLDPAPDTRYQQLRPDYRGEYYHVESFQRRPPSVTEQESRLPGPSSSRQIYHHPQQHSLYPPGRGLSEHDREAAVFAAHLSPFTQERHTGSPGHPAHPSQAPPAYAEQRIHGIGRGYSEPAAGDDPLSLQSLAIHSQQPQTPIIYPPLNRPHQSPPEEDDGATERSAEKETTVDHRSEAGETSSSLGKRRAGPESEAAEDDDSSPRPKKVSKKTAIACNFCRGRKLKCDGQTPTCRNCDKRSLPCEYALFPRRRGPGKAPKGSKKHAKAALMRASTDFSLTPSAGLSGQQQPVERRPRPRGTIDTLPEYTVNPGMGVSVLDPGPPPPPPPPGMAGHEMEQQEQFQRSLGQQVVFPVEPWVGPERTAGPSGSSSSERREFVTGRSESDVQTLPPMMQQQQQQAPPPGQQDEGHDVHDQRHERHDTTGMYKFIQEGFPPPPPPPGPGG
ncbi:hypothetical protein EIP91_006573 [Steccherinum ochraceum]|uniref:Zn(2)-C6 fungal-type domain-containing protein n=1 Tax=Steccherinum ochraceum TaxID=92696 RepID=A0A4R0R5F7_9APHY|nr:hypothetical protein EIP91_006573 [Steccherinum ochraceum]